MGVRVLCQKTGCLSKPICGFQRAWPAVPMSLCLVGFLARPRLVAAGRWRGLGQCAIGVDILDRIVVRKWIGFGPFGGVPSRGQGASGSTAGYITNIFGFGLCQFHATCCSATPCCKTNGILTVGVFVPRVPGAGAREYFTKRMREGKHWIVFHVFRVLLCKGHADHVRLQVGSVGASAWAPSGLPVGSARGHRQHHRHAAEPRRRPPRSQPALGFAERLVAATLWCQRSVRRNLGGGGGGCPPQGRAD